jgi:hypothetical protein
MHARLMKETRELLPIFVGTLLLIVVPYLIWHHDAEPFGYIALGLGCAVLGACAFGNEFQHRTLALLLSQPIARSVLWREKMLILGASMAACVVVSAACLQVYSPGLNLAGPLILALIALCAYCGAPYWTLVSRYGFGGMAGAMSVPTLLMGLTALVTWWLFDDEVVEQISASVILIPYCAVVFWGGYGEFKRLEDYDRTTRELTLPASLEAALARPLARVSSRVRGPFGSLLKKELRLQQVSFLLAGVFFLIAVVGFCLIPIYLPAAEGTLGGDCAFFVLILPLVAGAMAVAEEKGWDLAEWHLTLPPSALQQWSAKMLAALTTSLALGLLLPAAMFLAGAAMIKLHGSSPSFPSAFGLVPWMLGQLLLTSVAMYAASFSKSTLRAILGALGMMIASSWLALLIGTWLAKTFGLSGLSHHDGKASLVLPVLLAGLVLLLCLTQWFAWRNFRNPGAPVHRLAIQLLVMLFAVGLVTLAVSAAM